MPQPAGPQSAEAFVGRSRELALLSAALRQAATGDGGAHLDQGVRTGTRCSYSPPKHPG